ncbi:PREDICTED: cytochrome P450 2F2-like [Priapulus caudatus]|uniref:Cytochrome P450 2F2-like n=1 Tax=Priapulus caudatus TaxID=37621 RepID=A0ABM1DZQ4_PRICU|nr:PREDICTED: cytochrome P450 2F2-like [Priapulus caudatus]
MSLWLSSSNVSTTAFTCTSTQTILVAVIISLLLRYAWDQVRKGRNLPPGPVGWPLLANLSVLRRSAHASLAELSQRYGDVTSLYIGRRLVVVLSSYAVIREAFVKQGDVFAGRPQLFIDDLSDEHKGIITTDGRQWKQLRKFALVALRQVGMGKPKMERLIADEVSGLLGMFRDTGGRAFDPRRAVVTSVANVVCRMLFGVRYEHDDADFAALLHDLDATFELARNASVLNFAPLLRFVPGGAARRDYVAIDAGVQRLKAFIDAHVGAHEATYDPGHARDITDLFLAEMKKADADAEVYNVEQLKIFLLNLFVGGTMTTFLTIRCSLRFLSEHKSIQKKVQAELEEVIGSGRLPRFQDRKNLPYTEATIMEVQRFGPVVPLGIVHCNTEHTSLRGYEIPKHAVVFANIWSLHMSKEFWGDPETFRPERFFDGTGSLMRPDNLLPFSIGRRVCPGEALAKMELVLFITSILQHFTLTLEAEEELPRDAARGKAWNKKPIAPAAYYITARVRC